jgi:acyl dehydratase
MGIDTTDTSEVRTLSTSHPDEAPRLAGGRFVTPWFTLDPDRAGQFEKGTYLDSYAHPYGGGEGYGEDLVEGYHLLGMFDYLLNYVLWSDGPWIAWNYGLDRVRFTSVIRWSDPFRLSGTVTEVVPRGEHRHLLVLDVTGQVRGRDKPGFVATQRLLWAAFESPHQKA